MIGWLANFKMKVKMELKMRVEFRVYVILCRYRPLHFMPSVSDSNVMNRSTTEMERKDCSFKRGLPVY